MATGRPLWEGKPAPRCFTFRNWRRSVFGILLLLPAVFVQASGWLVEAVYGFPLLGWAGFVLLLLALYLALGHLLLARLEWARVHYTLEEDRLLVSGGVLRRRHLEIPLTRLSDLQLEAIGPELGNLRLVVKDSPMTLTLHCLEHPGQVMTLFRQALSRSGATFSTRADN